MKTQKISFCFFFVQNWALAFRNDPDLKQVEHFYQECKQQGLSFPPADPENIIKAAVPATVSGSLCFFYVQRILEKFLGNN